MHFSSSSRVRASAAVGVAALVALGMAAAQAETATPSTAQRVTDGTAYDRNPAVVQDGTTTWMFFARTHTDPCNRTACLQDGVNSISPSNANYDLYVESSTDRGRTWSSPTEVAANSSTAAPFRGRTPSATVDANGVTWVFWASGSNSAGLYYTHNDGPGSNDWAALSSLDDQPYFNVNVVTRGATTYVYYENGGDGSVYVRTFDGHTFSDPQLVATGLAIPKAIVDRTGTFRLAMVDPSLGDVYVGSSTDGVTWTGTERVVEAAAGVTDWDPALVQTPDGAYHLFYAPDLGVNHTQQLAQVTSTDFATWSAPTQVTTAQGYEDYWPTPTTVRGLSLFYTSEAGPPDRTGHVYEMETPVPPTSKNQCKDGGWAQFTDPVFANQGQCVSSVQSRR